MSQEYDKRKRAHTNMLRSNTHNNLELQLDWNRYGEDEFSFNIVDSFDTKEECMIAEMERVAFTDNTYNIVKDKSVGGDIFTHNPRKEIIRDMRVKQMTGKGNHQYGKVKSEKMINSVKEANSKRISIDDEVYISITEASKSLNIGISTIVYRLNSKSERFDKWFYLK